MELLPSDFFKTEEPQKAQRHREVLCVFCGSFVLKKSASLTQRFMFDRALAGKLIVALGQSKLKKMLQFPTPRPLRTSYCELFPKRHILIPAESENLGNAKALAIELIEEGLYYNTDPLQ